MKKVLSLLLAVVLVCSMATVALGLDYTWTCDVCGGVASSASDYNYHILNEACGTCAHCEKGFSAADLGTHEYICPKANIKCDYCGDTYASESDYAEHIAACKKSHFYIPFALIIEHVKAYIGKIDFKKAFEGAKNFFGYVVTIGKDIAGSVGA